MDRAVATAVEAIGNASRENKEFIVGKTPTGSPDGKRAMSAIFSWRHWRNPLVVDDKPVSKCINPISRASDYGLENVPVVAVVSGTSAYITPRRRRNAEVHKFADGRFFRRTQIQAGCDARRCVDDDHVPADDGWKDCPCRNESEYDSLEPPSRPLKPGMKATIEFSRLGIEFIRQSRSPRATDAAEFYALPRSRMTVAIAPTSCRGASGLQ